MCGWEVGQKDRVEHTILKYPVTSIPHMTTNRHILSSKSIAPDCWDTSSASIRWYLATCGVVALWVDRTLSLLCITCEPNNVHLFYKNESQFTFGTESDEVKPRHGQQEIHQRIQESEFKDCQSHLRINLRIYESQYLPVHQPPRSTGDIVNLTFETIRTQTLNLKTIQGANGESSVIAMMSVKTPAKMSNNKPKNPSSTVTSWTQLSSEVGQELSR
ncbi:hypothetical protein SeMB42_g03570 [Synchytrium endobioticum]|uniref:Uncharacterized protein n=1 Tax=Synchytrium endobioticum TaxID=286115 RepID=A0A507D644_9FUNG|nr:hypothetical protein SeMB42_g03570 [Synchytrium endobioticum]